MRLIDADKLMEDFRNTITEKSDTMDWLNMIYRQPTAYSVDEVVAELENLKDKGSVTKTEMLITKSCIDKAIEIVKQGSVGKDVE